MWGWNKWNLSEPLHFNLGYHQSRLKFAIYVKKKDTATQLAFMLREKAVNNVDFTIDLGINILIKIRYKISLNWI